MKKQATQIVCSMAFMIAGITACKKDPIIVTVPPSDGTVQTLDGGTGGASATNTVFVDLSTNKTTSVARQSWDLGLYAGSEFRVLLNQTTSAGAFVTTKTDLAQVTGTDTIGLTLAVSQAAPQPAHFAYFDDIDGDLTKTVIPAVSATAADNKVVILNRGTGGGIAARPWLKLRILRNGTTGYTVQYAGINETSFKTITVNKDAAHHFQFISFTTNNEVQVEPAKAEWDLQWGYSLFKTNFGADVPYNFSDLVSINYLSGVKVAEVLTSTVAYADYGEANINNTNFSGARWTIGSNWRATTGTAIGVKTDRFYVIKDVAGNVYKLKFNSFISNDGGERGKPVIEYKLVKKA